MWHLFEVGGVMHCDGKIKFKSYSKAEKILKTTKANIQKYNSCLALVGMTNPSKK
jgi:hypothetical protein